MTFKFAMLVARLRSSHGSWAENTKVRNEAAQAIIEMWQELQAVKLELDAAKLEKGTDLHSPT